MTPSFPPFYSYNTGLTADTGRDVMVPCVDMNGDGLLEIPTDAKLKGLPTQVRGVDWCKYKSSVLVHTGYSLAVQEDGYQMVLPDKQFKSVTVSYADKSHRLTVKSKTDKRRPLKCCRCFKHSMTPTRATIRIIPNSCERAVMYIWQSAAILRILP